ncbi:MAG: DNA mismatch repair endonuclease MutL, partial [Muribaculaceae bacterium]|nr:DNA mismatch repair endonuclease MutL [Muribaculaceae bacterium]
IRRQRQMGIRERIQLVDNGRGMTETDARMAFERHATSKISSAEDLFNLRTMGFRGEALPSICAIAQIELLTRTADDSIGTRLIINATKVESQEPVMCDVGTNIMVRNIFYNVPARRKFLKSDSVELSNIMREFERLALVNNHIHMLIDTGGRVLDLRAGSFKQRISDIWKNNLNMQLLPVEVDTALGKIEGFISRPEFARRRNPLQYLIANGRNMRHPYFHKAIVNCYDSLIATDTQPCYFLKFEVDPDSIDVNIHPTKSEIKFEYEQQIWPILQAAVKASLGQFGAVPSIDFNSDVLPVEPIGENERPEAPALDLKADYNPFAESEVKPASNPFESSRSERRAANSSWRPTQMSGNWDRLYNDFMSGGGEVIEAAKLPELDVAEVPQNAICVQFARRYIVTATRSGLLIIDQHRAHVKILYERFLSHALKGAQVGQRVMFPEVIVLDPEHEAALEEAREALNRLGFVLEHDDNDRWKITTVPGIPGSLRGADVIMALLDDMCDGSLHYGNGSLTPELLIGRIALATARSNAVERGQRLTGDEMEHIVGELFSLPEPARGPDGKAVYVSLDESRIEHYL